MKNLFWLSTLVFMIFTLTISVKADSLPTDYAIKPIDYLKNNTEITMDYFSDYKASVNRQDFAYFSVVLYYKLIGRPIDLKVKKENNFVDTNDKFINKVYELGIINGISEKKFAPDLLISRE